MLRSISRSIDSVSLVHRFRETELGKLHYHLATLDRDVLAVNRLIGVIVSQRTKPRDRPAELLRGDMTSRKTISGAVRGSLWAITDGRKLILQVLRHRCRTRDGASHVAGFAPAVPLSMIVSVADNAYAAEWPTRPDGASSCHEVPGDTNAWQDNATTATDVEPQEFVFPDFAHINERSYFDIERFGIASRPVIGFAVSPGWWSTFWPGYRAQPQQCQSSHIMWCV